MVSKNSFLFCPKSTVNQRIYCNKCIHIRNSFRYNQCFTFLAWLNLKTLIHMYTHTPTSIYTHAQTTTHKRNLNDFLSAFCRIFDFCLYFVAFFHFQFHSIFLTAWWMLLKTSWNLRLLNNIFHGLNIYIIFIYYHYYYIYIYIYIYIY